MERFIKNPFCDYDQYVAKCGKTSKDLESKFSSTPECLQTFKDVRAWIREKVDEILKSFPPKSSIAPASLPRKSQEDFSLYVGTGGNAYLHWKLHEFFQEEKDEERAEAHLKHAADAVSVARSLLDPPSARSIAFYLGNTGVIALAAVLSLSQRDSSTTTSHLQELASYLQYALAPSAVDEVLYGRAGYLMSLLFVRKHVPFELFRASGLEPVMRSVFSAIVESGKRSGSSSKRVLSYNFYGTDYHGAAHGAAGILFALMQFPEWCREPAVAPWVQNTLDKMASYQLPSGNVPPSAREKNYDKLVHWCHGAPGVAGTFHLAHKVYGHERYEAVTDRALRVVWERGLLRKGFGLCHGMAGNAYAFLLMYRYTGEDAHYYRAVKMSQFLMSDEASQAVAGYQDPQRYCVGVADFPYSLMEGLAGTICYLCDLLHPECAAFPGYDGDIN